MKRLSRGESLVYQHQSEHSGIMSGERGGREVQPSPRGFFTLQKKKGSCCWSFKLAPPCFVASLVSGAISDSTAMHLLIVQALEARGCCVTCMAQGCGTMERIK